MSTKKGGAGKWVAIVVGGCGCLVVVGGILAAIAIPSFIGYVRKSKTAEATANVEAIFAGVSSYHAMNGELPASLPRTPAQPGCEVKVAWPPDAAPGWSDVGFTPYDPVYYAYEYERQPDGRSFVVRAVGDLDCDGTTSLFELRGTAGPTGVDRGPGLRTENETE